VEFEFSMVVAMKNTTFWGATLCSLVEMYLNFGRISVNIQRTVFCKTPEDSIF
jgi:hypothetical protein